MNLRSIISGGISTVMVIFVLAGCASDRNHSNTSLEQLAAIGFSDSSLKVHDPVTIRLSDSDMYTGNRFLNTVDWELRQPRDYSNSKITTTANSAADYVNLSYTCSGETKTSRITPLNGKFTHSIDWNCKDILEANIEAVSTDTITIYKYEINISLLNTLSH